MMRKGNKADKSKERMPINPSWVEKHGKPMIDDNPYCDWVYSSKIYVESRTHFKNLIINTYFTNGKEEE